jgi:hypothetical protein
VRNALLKLGALAIMLGLTACASPEELRAADEAACASYGFQPNTPDFAGCLQRESLARQYAPPPPGWYGPGWYPPTTVIIQKTR